MEGKTASGFSCKIQEEIKGTDETRLVDLNGHEDQETERSHPRMDQLLQNREYETKPQKDRRAVAYAYENCHLETVENKRKAILGTA